MKISGQEIVSTDGYFISIGSIESIDIQLMQ